MKYTKRTVQKLKGGSCLNFCLNVCSLFSSGRTQCVSDCLACSGRILLSPKVVVGPNKKKKCECGCR
jgi:hypothetical protein